MNFLCSPVRLSVVVQSKSSTMILTMLRRRSFHSGLIRFASGCKQLTHESVNAQYVILVVSHLAPLPLLVNPHALVSL